MFFNNLYFNYISNWFFMERNEYYIWKKLFISAFCFYVYNWCYKLNFKCTFYALFSFIWYVLFNCLFYWYGFKFFSAKCSFSYSRFTINFIIFVIFFKILGNLNYNCVLNLSTKKYEPQFLPLKFSVKTFYIIIFFWMCLTTISFVILHWCIPVKYKSKKNDQQSNSLYVINDEITPLNVN